MAAAPTLSPAPRIPRDRSRIVCQRCHARKVKCDLWLKLANVGSCSNCEKRSEICQRREPVRSRAHGNRHSDHIDSLSADAVLGTAAPSPSLVNRGDTPPDLGHHAPRRHSAQPNTTTADDQGYLGESSIFSNHGPFISESSTLLGAFSSSMATQILAATGADQLPSATMMDAHVAAYFKYLYHRIPVVDRQDVSSATRSVLLLQCLCLVGSMLRHPKSARSLVQSEEFYTKSKILLFISHEYNQLTTVKSLCLLALWNVRPPSVVTIDSGWNWLGLAIRLALQLGIHRESTYSQRAASSSARRVAWYLYTQDKLHSACFGRPQMLRTQDMDLRPLSPADFEQPESREARLFIIYTDLMKILAKMLSLQHREFSIASEELLSILSALKAWVASIPQDLRIFDDQGNRAYHRGSHEVHIWYFTCIVVYFHVYGRFFQPSAVSRVCMVASSCVIRLYQEMDHRDDVNYLMAINNWSMMAASVPQLNDLSREMHSIRVGASPSASYSLSLEELGIITEILKQRTSKFPGARALVERIERVRREILSNSFPPLEDTNRPLRISDTAMHLTLPMVHDLFPFPETLSPRIQLLEMMAAVDIPDSIYESYHEWSIEDVINLNVWTPLT